MEPGPSRRKLPLRPRYQHAIAQVARGGAITERPTGVDEFRKIEWVVLDDTGIGDEADLFPVAGLRIDEAETRKERVGILRPGHMQHDHRMASGILRRPALDLRQSILSAFGGVDLPIQINADLAEIFVGGRVGLLV